MPRTPRRRKPTDPQARVFDGKFERQLTDYGMLFHEMDRQISTAADAKVAAEKDAASLTAAVADAKEQVAFHTKEIADLKKELATSPQGKRNDGGTVQGIERRNREDPRGHENGISEESSGLAKRWTEIQTHLAELHETSGVTTQ